VRIGCGFISFATLDTVTGNVVQNLARQELPQEKSLIIVMQDLNNINKGGWFC
jgi:hypothetical protein